MIEDITERKQSERALQDANERLTLGIDELKIRNSEIAMLAKMSNVLQACLNLDAAYAAIATLIQPLFPNTSGGVFALDPSHTLVEAMTLWGNTTVSQLQFTPRACRALQQNHPHWMQQNHEK